MKTIILSVALLAATTYTASAQRAKDGGISEQTLKEISASDAQDSQANRALHNAIMTNSIDLIAKGQAQLSEVPSNFSVEVPAQSIQNQKSSGRCWSFSGLNVLRGKVAQQNNGEKIVFSHDFVFFYDQLEKANLFLQAIIDTGKKDFKDQDVQFLFQNPIGDGGTFCGVADIVEKYGLVPKSVFPETFSAENTSRFDKILKSKLREYALKLRKMVAEGKKTTAIQQQKKEMLKTVYRMLALAYGNPPTEFKYTHRDSKGKLIGEEKTYTPKSFAAEYGFDKLNGSFVMLMNDPRNEYYKLYEVELDRHTYDGHNWQYINLPMDEIEKLAIASLKDSIRMYSSYDVAKFLDRQRGFCSLDNFDYASLFQTEFPMTKAERIATFDSGSTHAMTLCAVDLDADGKPRMWKVENSWGTDSGQRGYLVMTEEWFKEYAFRLVIDKKYVPQNILEVLNQKPTMLKYDDPLFMTE